MLTGKDLFGQATEYKTYLEILKADLNFNKNLFLKEELDLLGSLLESNPEKRLGAG